MAAVNTAISSEISTLVSSGPLSTEVISIYEIHLGTIDELQIKLAELVSSRVAYLKGIQGLEEYSLFSFARSYESRNISSPFPTATTLALEIIFAQFELANASNGTVSLPGVRYEIVGNVSDSLGPVKAAQDLTCDLHRHSANIVKIHFMNNDGQEAILHTRLSWLMHQFRYLCGLKVNQVNCAEFLSLLGLKIPGSGIETLINLPEISSEPNEDHLLRLAIEANELDFYRPEGIDFSDGRSPSRGRHMSYIVGYFIRQAIKSRYVDVHGKTLKICVAKDNSIPETIRSPKYRRLRLIVIFDNTKILSLHGLVKLSPRELEFVDSLAEITA